jgi:energy-coupling factor transporter transmembrane protein EcfT
MAFLDQSARQFEKLWFASHELRSGGPPGGLLQQCTHGGRLAAAAFLLAAATTTSSLALLTGIYFLCALGALVSHIDVARYLRRNLLLVCMFALPLSLPGALHFVTPGEEAARVGPVAFSRQGIRSVVYVCLRALDAISITMLLVRSAGVQGVFRGLRELRVPEGVVAACQMTLGYIHLLGRTAHSMVLGLRARAVADPPLRRAYTAVSVQGAVLLQKSLASSRQVHAAMLARGFDGTFPRVRTSGRPGWQDALVLCICAAFAVAGVLS